MRRTQTESYTSRSYMDPNHKARLPLPELTARVSITRQHGLTLTSTVTLTGARFPLAELTGIWKPVTRQLWPSTRPELTGFHIPVYTGRQDGPSTRVVETGINSNLTDCHRFVCCYFFVRVFVLRVGF